MIGKTIADLSPGDRAEITRVVEDDDIAAFVDAVGDYNPVHSDPAYAATTPFKKPIAPGIFTAGLVSAVIGMCMVMKSACATMSSMFSTSSTCSERARLAERYGSYASTRMPKAIARRANSVPMRPMPRIASVFE